MLIDGGVSVGGFDRAAGLIGSVLVSTAAGGIADALVMSPIKFWINAAIFSFVCLRATFSLFKSWFAWNS